MAKKKKANNQLIQLVTLATIIFGVVALITMFLPTIGIKDTDTTFTGLQTAFGYSKDTLLGKATYFGFSFMNLLTYVLALAGVLIAVLGLVKNDFASAMFRLIATACFVASAIFFFTSVSFSTPNETLNTFVSGLGGNIKEALTLAYGAIMGGIAASLAAACEVLLAFVFKK